MDEISFSLVLLTFDLLLLFIAVILFIKHGIDPNKQRRRILLKLDKLPQEGPKNEMFDFFIKKIDRLRPMELQDIIPNDGRKQIVGFCYLCGAGRSYDAHFCHYCGFKFNNMEEVTSQQ